MNWFSPQLCRIKQNKQRSSQTLQEQSEKQSEISPKHCKFYTKLVFAVLNSKILVQNFTMSKGNWAE